MVKAGDGHGSAPPSQAWCGMKTDGYLIIYREMVHGSDRDDEISQYKESITNRLHSRMPPRIACAAALFLFSSIV